MYVSVWSVPLSIFFAGYKLLGYTFSRVLKSCSIIGYPFSHWTNNRSIIGYPFSHWTNNRRFAEEGKEGTAENVVFFNILKIFVFFNICKICFYQELALYLFQMKRSKLEIENLLSYQNASKEQEELKV